LCFIFQGSQNLNNVVQSKAQKNKRLKNFTTIEDEGLCSAYLNVSKDPIVGVNQPLGAYWDMIKAYIDENNKTTHSRSKSSLAHKWGDIQKDTSRFCECFVEIKRK
jgi:hemerythrin-like domain-containing protein